MVKMSPRHSFAIATRLRYLGQLTDVSESLARLAFNVDNLNTFYGNPNRDVRFRSSVNVFSEISFTYARVVLQQDRHFLKAGFTLKKISGLYASYALSRKADFTINQQPDPNKPLNQQDIINIQNVNLSYAYMNSDALTGGKDQSLGQVLQNNGLSYLFGGNSVGKGFGTDLGVTYEFRPDVNKLRYAMNGRQYIDEKAVKYMFRVGIALNDLGSIKYTSPYISAFDINASNKSLKPADLEGKSDTDFIKTINAALGVTDTQKKTEFTMGLPTSLSANIDYHLTGKLFLNATLIQNLVSKDKIASRQNNVFAITPRLETKVFGLSFPVSVINKSYVGLGAMLRVGPLFVGSDNLGAILGIGKPSGLDAYMGFTLLQIQTHKKDDRDGDGVSDKEDACINSPGTWEMKGCPDSDGDGISDENDRCPAQAGLKEYEGCPDSDGDKIEDSKDDCPTEPGLPQFNGCPDADEDGVVDNKDECPGLKGLPKFFGCPDTDGDEVPDKDDNCPETKGLLRFGGCPDTDGDGIQDSKDKCPEVAGVAQFEGCPDTDNDGIPNPADECPDQPGIPAFKGCPDTDGDGIPDKKDQCPQEYGISDNNGCPETEETKKQKAEALRTELRKLSENATKDIQFEPGKTVLLLISYPALDELADFLNLHTDMKIMVTGHTDNAGYPNVNLKLSSDRAEVVKTYLIKNGVPTKNVSARGLGSTKPLADNKTPEGRMKNRRIEFTLLKP